MFVDYKRNAKLEIEALDKMNVSKSLPTTLGRTNEMKEDAILAGIKASNDGPESLLQKIFAAKMELESAKLLLEYEKSLLEAAKNGYVSMNINNSKAISNIEKKNAVFEGGQKQLAVRQKALQHETEQAISKAVATRQAADTWWQQPAQYTVPWVTLNGDSLEEFINEWRSLCALLEVK